MIWFRLLFFIFACYRLAQLLPYDDGPFFIFTRLRNWLANKAGNESEALGFWHSLDSLVTCPYCQGFWISLPLAYFFTYPLAITDFIILWFGISGMQAFLQRYNESV